MSYEDAAAVALKVVEAINANTDINGSVVASSDSAGVVRISALQPGQPFTISEQDSNVALNNDVANGSVRYTPNANYNGGDSFTYTVANDAEVPSYSSATVRVDVTAVNDGPTTVADFGTVVSSAGTSVRVLSNDSDIDGDTLTITEVTFEGETHEVSGETTITGATTGSQVVVNPANGRISFVPEGDWYKALSADDVIEKVLSYKVADPGGVESDATNLTLTVQGVNDAPEVSSSAITLSGTEDGANVTGSLSDYASDPDQGSQLTFSVAAGGDPENGTLTVNPDGTFSYNPEDNFYGDDTFIFRVVDENGVAATKTVSINVASVNDAPTVVDEAVELAANKSVVLRVLSNDSDIEGQDISLKLNSVEFNGAAGAVTATQNADGTITITPDPNHALFVDLAKNAAAAVQTISYTVQDTEGGETDGQVNLTVLGVEGPPVAGDDTAQVTEGGSVVVDVLANDTDKDNDDLTVLTPTAGQYGTTTLNADGTITYNASASTLESLAVGQQLTDTFDYSITDGTNFTDATVTVTITGENDVPVTSSDVARARENGDVVLVDLFYNDRDVDVGDNLVLHMPEMVSGEGATLYGSCG